MKHKLFAGQALITLLIFVIIALTLTAGAIALTITNSQAASGFDRGNQAYYVAESGAENAVLRLLRDPNYTGETLAVGQDNAQISVSGTNPYTIVSTGRSGGFLRKVHVIVNFTNGVLTVTSWKEIF